MKDLLQSKFVKLKAFFGYVRNEVVTIVPEFKSGQPLQVGRALTKAFAIIVVFLAILPQHTENNDWQFRIVAFLLSPPNEIGDTFAGLAGVLAFLWIIITVWLQSEELSAQRKELKATRAEVTLSRKAYEKTNINLEQQRFESLFFELLSTHNSIVNSIDLRKTGDKGTVIGSGRDCFKDFAKALRPIAAVRMYADQENDKTDTKYDNLYKKYHSDLGHYFRFTYNSMRVISESDFSGKSHKRLYRALFSDDELLLLFYNARSRHGEKMITYIEEFEMFNNLPEDRIIYAGHKDYFNKKCFGDE
jgi:hypothetical protein